MGAAPKLTIRCASDADAKIGLRLHANPSPTHVAKNVAAGSLRFPNHSPQQDGRNCLKRK